VRIENLSQDRADALIDRLGKPMAPNAARDFNQKTADRAEQTLGEILHGKTRREDETKPGRGDKTTNVRLVDKVAKTQGPQQGDKTAGRGPRSRA
jgi:hypothetical protein